MRMRIAVIPITPGFIRKDPIIEHIKSLGPRGLDSLVQQTQTVLTS